MTQIVIVTEHVGMELVLVMKAGSEQLVLWQLVPDTTLPKGDRAAIPGELVALTLQILLRPLVLVMMAGLEALVRRLFVHSIVLEKELVCHLQLHLFAIVMWVTRAAIVPKQYWQFLILLLRTDK